ncbi:prostaglandin E2 receptor EP2 subtype [Hemicordylus capensis]|uniref:prostaglandin E2 receptor EP2 subtype n=1 Tax=Hemicordylus capensis TaxID=884348 RepID=UPI002302412C|nr:prostaglandin E2 receptor EP2 subtype [Hemicordylus capensis]
MLLDAADRRGNATSCERKGGGTLPSDESPLIAALMFAAGVLGNVLALALLLLARRRRQARRERPAPFNVLSTALVLTDLLGTCLISPVVLAAYGRGRSLEALAGKRQGGPLCHYFAFAMSFFSLATMGSLAAMALERSLAFGAPYCYARLLSGRRRGALLLGALPAFDALAAAFCALPLLGFGRHVQYYPGTWCFIQLRFAAGNGTAARSSSAERGELTFSLLYASALLLLILFVVLCNLSVIVHLLCLHRRGKDARRVAPLDGRAQGRPGGDYRRPLSMSEELDQLILLSIMTIIFVVCSLPFTIRAFRNSFILNTDCKKDLQALRFLSINSIIDPWVFVILRPSVLRVVRSVLCYQIPLKRQTHPKQGPCPEPTKQADVCRQ